MNKSKALKIVKKLKETYPEAKCSLNFNSPFELVVAVMLSAQCTDERVNKVTPFLFARYMSIQDFAYADITELEKIIHPCGFYKSKAKNVKFCAQKIITNFNGKVPSNMDELLTLPGIGRKSANVILLDAFNSPCGIAVDTHAKRISNKIGFSKESDPEKIEQDLLKLIPYEYIKDANHLLVWHGRNCCIARNPKCDTCPINNLCETFKTMEKVK